MADLLGSIGIDYDDADAATYKGVDVYTRDIKGVRLRHLVPQRRRFSTGDANFDYHCGMLWLELAGCESVIGSSSCDHFCMDGGVLDLDAEGLRPRLMEQADRYRAEFEQERVEAQEPHAFVSEYMCVPLPPAPACPNCKRGRMQEVPNLGARCVGDYGIARRGYVSWRP